MIERNIPRDLEKYKAKFLGPFTKRQIFFGVPAIGLAVGIYFLTRNAIGEFSILLAILVGGPLMLCAVYQPYNIPFEQYAKIVLVTYLLSPKRRLYKCESRYDKAFKQIIEEQRLQELKENKKNKNKDKTVTKKAGSSSAKKRKAFVSKNPEHQKV